MPILRGHDSKGPYYKVYRTKTKYHYLPNNEISRKTLAKEKAVTQLHKRESIDKKNIITSKRQIKKPTRFISF